MYEKGFSTLIPTTASNKVPVFNVEMENVFKKVQKMVKIFQRSLVKNKVLQKYVLLNKTKSCHMS